MPAKLGLSTKRIIYTICFFFFCLIDQRTKTVSGLDGWGETFYNLTGVVMSVLILSHYHPDDFKKRKIPYLVWSLVCAIGGAAFLIYGQPLAYFLNGRIAMTAAVYLLGIVLIHTFTDIVTDRKRPRLNRPFACAWLAMILLMLISRSGYRWPFEYLLMFGCFYLTDFTEAEREDLFQGMLNGIILGFFLLQGWCFVFRPYDEIRYVGVYNNCNMNALFYLAVLAAALAKLLYVYRRECSRWIRLYYWVGTGTVLSFLFMTISRTGWMTAAVLVFVCLVFLWRISARGNFVTVVFRNGLLVVLCCVLTFPPVFGAVRYLPPLFHHPVWFFGEWSEDKVHSWDPWDSEKFVDLDKLLSTSVSRVTKIVEGLFGTSPKTGQAESAEPMVGAETDDDKPEVTPLQQQLYDEALEAGYAMDVADSKNALLTRKAIYRYYVHLLNFRGHPDSELGFQITPRHNIGHAHNIYLQYGVSFGIPVMLLFMVLTVWSAAEFARRFVREKSEYPAGCLFVVLVPAVFGLLEYCWGRGSLAMILLFVVWRGMVCDERQKGQE